MFKKVLNRMKPSVSKQIERDYKKEKLFLENAYNKLPRQKIVNVSGERTKKSVVSDKKKEKDFYEKAFLKQLFSNTLKKETITNIIRKTTKIHTHLVSEKFRHVLPGVLDVVDVIKRAHNGATKNAIYVVETIPNLKTTGKVIGKIVYRLNLDKISKEQKKNLSLFIKLAKPTKKGDITFLREYFLKTCDYYKVFEYDLNELINKHPEIRRPDPVDRQNAITNHFYLKYNKRILKDMGIRTKKYFSKDYFFEYDIGTLDLK